MSGPDADREGLREGLESSHGDPRVLLVLNAVLSMLFAWMLVTGADFVGMLEFSLASIAIVAGGLFVLTHLVTRS